MGGIRNEVCLYALRVRGGMAFYHSDLFGTRVQKGQKRCTRGAQEVNLRALKGTWYFSL